MRRAKRVSSSLSSPVESLTTPIAFVMSLLRWRSTASWEQRPSASPRSRYISCLTTIDLVTLPALGQGSLPMRLSTRRAEWARLCTDGPGARTPMLEQSFTLPSIIFDLNRKIMWDDNSGGHDPKFGIYRSLDHRNELRDEQVRFADFCVSKVSASECQDGAAPPTDAGVGKDVGGAREASGRMDSP